MSCYETFNAPLQQLHTLDLQGSREDSYLLSATFADNTGIRGIFPHGVGNKVPDIYEPIEEYSTKQLT